MPIVLAGAGVGLAAIIAFIVLYGLLSNLSAWLRPLVDALTVSNRGLLLKIVFFPLYAVGRILTSVVAWVTSWLSQAVAQKVRPMVAWLESLSLVTDKLLLNIEGLATDTAGALHRLTTKWIPAKIDAAITPVEKLANTALVRAGNALDYARTQTALLRGDLTDLTRYVERTVWPYAVRLQARVENVIEPRLDDAWTAATRTLPNRIDQLAGQVGDVAGLTSALGGQVAAFALTVPAEIAGAVGDVRADLQRLIDRGATATAGELAALSQMVAGLALSLPASVAGQADAIRRELDDLIAAGAAATGAELAAIRDRIAALEGSIPLVGAIGAAAVAAVTEYAPDLFCRNTRDLTRRVCGLDPTDLLGLLGGAAALTLALDAREVIRLGQALAEESADLVRGLAGI